MTRASERYRLLLEQLVEEHGGKQKPVVELVGAQQSTVSKILTGERPAGMDVVNRAMDRLQIRREFFFEPMRSEPSWRDFVEGSSASDEPPTGVRRKIGAPPPEPRVELDNAASAQPWILAMLRMAGIHDAAEQHALFGRIDQASASTGVRPEVVEAIIETHLSAKRKRA